MFGLKVIQFYADIGDKNHFSQNSIFWHLKPKRYKFCNIFTPHPPTPDTSSLHSQHLILPLFAPSPRQSSNYNEGVGVKIIKDVVSGVSGWGVKISQILDHLASRAWNIEKTFFSKRISRNILCNTMYLTWKKFFFRER